MTKYNPAERGDYLNILLWSALLVASGIFLRWPGRLGIPGPGSYYWLRVIHAGCGTAWTIHLLSAHIPDRWLRSSGPFRRAILTGTVPLGEASTRTDWIADLVSAGMLVPAPEETPQEDRQESGQVRDLLELGNRLTREERYEEAVNAFEEALALYPQYSQARFNLGVARMRMGHMEQAKEQFRLFIEADPFNPIAGRAREMLEEIVGEKKRG
jgi:tetratricopeptide (TPR) repeat protein